MKYIKRYFWVIIYFCVVLGVTFILYSLMNAGMKQPMLNSLSEISELNLNRIHDIVYKRVKELERVASNYTNIDENDFKNHISNLKEIAKVMQFQELGVATTQGTAYMTTDTQFNITQRDYFQKAMQGEQDVSDVLTDLRSKESVVIYSTPIKDQDGKVKGVLFGIDDVQSFADIFQTTLFKGEGYTYLVDENGNIIFKSPNIKKDFDNIFDSYENFKGNEKVIQEVKKNLKETDSFSYYVNNYGNRYTNMSKTDINDWWIVVGVSENVLQNQVDGVTNIIKVIILCFLLFSLIGLYIYLRIQRKHELRLQNIAYIDRLTGIYNTNYLHENYYDVIKRLPNKKYALVTYDVNKFKLINEIYGEQIGDVILKKIAQSFTNELNSKYELVVRDHADEFIGLYAYDSKEELEQRLQKLVESLDIVQYRKNKVKIKFSIGIYEGISSKYPIERIIGYARIAKAENKRYKGVYHYFNEDLKDFEMKQKRLIDSIQDAIQRKEFKAWLQPQYDSQSKKMIGAEALVRWHKEDGTVLTPYHFVDFCEKSGLIQEIDQLILEDVCKQLKKWMKQGLHCVPVAINLSRAYLNDVDAIYSIKEIVDKYEIPPSLIKLEITESAITNREEELSEIIRVMHEFGFGVSLDDFGVGYSSLISINNLNFDVLKIDKSFVDAIGTKKGDYIVSYTIHLAKNLGMKLIAEGIETKEQYSYLKSLQCDVIQGYYFSKPICKEEFEKLLSKE